MSKNECEKDFVANCVTYKAKGIKSYSLDDLLDPASNLLPNDNGVFVVNVVGDSMEPKIRDKSLIFIKPLENDNNIIHDSAVYVVEVDKRLFVKRVIYNPATKKFTLMSDNKKYEPIELDKKPNFIGKVVGTLSKI